MMIECVQRALTPRKIQRQTPIFDGQTPGKALDWCQSRPSSEGCCCLQSGTTQGALMSVWHRVENTDIYLCNYLLCYVSAKTWPGDFQTLIQVTIRVWFASEITHPNCVRGPSTSLRVLWSQSLPQHHLCLRARGITRHLSTVIPSNLKIRFLRPK